MVKDFDQLKGDAEIGVRNYKGSDGKVHEFLEISRDVFSLAVMGFTTAKRKLSILWKNGKKCLN